MKMAADSWGQTDSAWSNPFQQTRQSSGRTSRSRDSLDSLLKTWRMISSTMGKPENLQANLAGLEELPQVMMKLACISLDGVNRLQESMYSKVNMTSGRTVFNFDTLDERFFEEWKTLYETEIRKYFNIPQLGLMRFQQEKFNQAADKFQVLQTTMAEFTFILSKPFEASMKTLQDQLVEQSENNKLSGDAREIYNRWIGILEADFTKLMKSPEYVKSLGRVLSAQAAYSRTKDDIIQDLAANMPFAGRREMDDLYKELYRLRKRVRDLEKEKGK